MTPNQFRKLALALPEVVESEHQKHSDLRVDGGPARHSVPAWKVRRATEADVPVLMEIRFAVRENVLSDPGKVTSEMCVDYLDRLGRGWVAELDGGVVGFSYAARADNSIWALFVRPEHEGKGIGKRLLMLATAWLFEIGAERVVLSTDCDTRADRFYAAQGWRRGAMKDEREVVFTLERDGG